MNKEKTENLPTQKVQCPSCKSRHTITLSNGTICCKEDTCLAITTVDGVNKMLFEWKLEIK